MELFFVVENKKEFFIIKSKEQEKDLPRQIWNLSLSTTPFQSSLTFQQISIIDSNPNSFSMLLDKPSMVVFSG
jgi:hypothetical protein